MTKTPGSGGWKRRHQAQAGQGRAHKRRRVAQEEMGALAQAAPDKISDAPGPRLQPRSSGN